MTARHLVSIGLSVWLFGALATAFGQEEKTPALPADRCHLRLDLPPETTVELDGRDYGTQREFVFQGLDPELTYQAQLLVKFPAGDQQRRTVLVEGGRRIQWATRPTSAAAPELVVQLGRREDNSHAISADGQWIAFGGKGNASLWQVDTGRRLRTYRFPEQAKNYDAERVAISADRRRLAAATVTGVCVWEIASGRVLNWIEHRPHTSVGGMNRFPYVEALALNGGGTQLVLHMQDFSMEQTSADRRTASEHDRFDPKFEIIASGRTLLWNLAQSGPPRSIEHPSILRSCTVVSGDGTLMAVAQDIKQPNRHRGAVVVWDLRTMRRHQTLQHDQPIHGLDFTADNSYLLCVSSGADDLLQRFDDRQASDLFVFELASGRQIHRVETGGDVVSATLNRQTDRIFATHKKQDAALYDAETGRQLRSFPEISSPFVAFLPEGKHVLVGDKVVDTQTGSLLRTIQGYSTAINSVAFSPNGQHILIDAMLWDTAEGKPVRAFPGRQAVFSPDGLTIATTGGAQGQLMVFDTATGRRVAEFSGQEIRPNCLAFSPDGLRLAAGSLRPGPSLMLQDTSPEDVMIWDLATGRRLLSLDQAIGSSGVAFGPGGRRLVAAADKSDLCIWDTQSGRKLLTLPNTEGCRSVQFAPDGRYVLAAEFGRVVMLDATTGQLVRSFPCDGSPARSLAFSPDGRRILAAVKQEAVVWDTQTGQKLRVFRGHADAVSSAAFSFDGQRVLTGSSDGTARLWDLATGEELLQLVNVDQEGQWLVATSRGFFDGSASGRQAVTYRLGQSLDVVPVDRFFQDFYRPGLLTEVGGGARPLPDVSLANQPAPLVRILEPRSGTETHTGQVQLQLEVVDRGGGVKGPWLWHNGARILASSSVGEQEGKRTVYSFTVSVVEGENRLEARAANEDGSWESEPAVVLVRYAEPGPEARLYLLAIGVNRYAEEAMNLRFAAADAQAMAQLFRERAGRLYGQDHVHIRQLLDSQATTEAIRQALVEIGSRAHPQDTLVVFLAGHGTTVGQRYYFIPHEYRQQADRLQDDVRNQGLAGDVLGDWLATVPALKRVVIFDTCQSGAVIGLTSTARNPFALRGAVERLSRAQGAFTIAATSASEEAQEVPELEHGVLTYVLLAGLQAVDQGPLKRQYVKTKNSEVVDVRDWFSFAQDNVPPLTRLYFGQEQFVGFSGQGTSFPILPLAD